MSCDPESAKTQIVPEPDPDSDPAGVVPGPGARLLPAHGKTGKAEQPPRVCPQAGLIIPNAYKILARCVEEGVAYGYNRAHKHVDNPTGAQLCEAIESAVLNAICEYFTFPDPE